jgi:predicted RNA polymerase sigma factor
VLVSVNDHASARRTLERVDGTKLSPSLHAKHAQVLATVCLELGELERAEAVLRDARDSEDDPLTTRWLRITRALLFAVQGGTESAIALVGEEDDDEDDPAFRASNEIVRAHVHACLGRENEARHALEQARELAGVTALTRAIRPVGPATELARLMLARDVERMRGAMA